MSDPDCSFEMDWRRVERLGGMLESSQSEEEKKDATKASLSVVLLLLGDEAERTTLALRRACCWNLKLCAELNRSAVSDKDSRLFLVIIINIENEQRS
jgi:hypothetical protein